ncbi:MAG TPA: hypothetical protein PLP19_10290 [bacterium]|nr:hypothetical protein [bacterium]HPN43868.1 hypothetical protein [bacterium]
MQMKRMLPAIAFVAMLWFAACESPVSTSVKSGDLARTEYAVYTSADRIYDPAWSPDGSQIAFVKQSMAMDLYKMSPAGDTLNMVKRFYKYSPVEYRCAVSPDGLYIVYRWFHPENTPNRYTVSLHNIQQNKDQFLNVINHESASQFQWSRDSRTIFYVNTDADRYTINGITLEGTPVFTAPLDSIDYLNSYSVSPVNHNIVFSGDPQRSYLFQIWLISEMNGQEKLLADDSTSYYNPSWSPDGNSIAYVARNENYTTSLNLYSFTTNSSRTLIDSMDISRNDRIIWSDDGQSLYFIGYDYGYYETTSGLWQFSLTDNSFSLLCNNITDQILQINSDGSFYINSDDDYLYCLYSYLVTNKTVTPLIPETKDELSSPAWSPDGANLVFTKARKLYRVAATGSNPVWLGVSGTDQYNPCFSPDGSLIAFDNNNQVFVMSVNDGRVTSITPLSKYYLRCPAWSPDGKQIACAYKDYSANDSLMIYNYSEEGAKRLNAWPGRYTDIAWSKPHQTFGSYLLFAKVVDPKVSYSRYELSALNPETGKLVKFLGYGGSFKKFSQDYLYACWAPDAESIAWIDRGYSSSYGYSLNIARIFVDLQ